jgi:hypothetical protein
MDTLDWILAAVFTVLFGVAAYFVFPPYGAIIGVALACLLIWRAKKTRDHLRGRS